MAAFGGNRRARTGKMLEGFVIWLQEHLIEKGSFAVVQASLGILSFAALLSALLGSTAIRAGGVVVVVLGVLAVFLTLLSGRHERRWRSDLDSKLLAHYCDSLEKVHGQRWRIVDWVQEVQVSENGDAREEWEFSVVADCDRLEFVSFHSSTNWDWPEKYRRKVRVDVRTSRRGKWGGMRLDATHCWIRRETVKTFVHLDRPLSRGQRISLAVEVFWPAKCLPFVRGYTPDEFRVAFANAVPLVRYVVALPRGWHVISEGVGFAEDEDGYSLTAGLNRHGQMEMVLTAQDVPEYRRIGLKVDRRPVAAE